MMRNLIVVIAATSILFSMVGCANGPLRRWRGAPCNTCNPPINQPVHGNLLSGCESGACGTGTCGTGVCSSGTAGNGFLGGLFRSGNQTVAPPVSLPASSFDAAPAAIGTTGELYGNPNSTGQLELPPNTPFN